MKFVTLPSIAEIIMGQSPPSEAYNKEGRGLPFYQGKTDFGELYPTPRMYCTAPKKIAQSGDILLSVRAPVGPTNISPAKSCIGRGLAAIRPSSKVDQKYLLYFLRFHESDLAKLGQGSTFEAIGKKELHAIELPFLPLPEQQRIAGILARADRLRQLRRTALQLSEGYLQSVFLQLFGDPVTNPMGWERATTVKLGVVKTGNTPSRKEPKYFGDYIEWIKTDNIFRDQMYLSRSIEGLSKAGLRVGRYVEAGSILVTCIAGSEKSIGDVAFSDRKVAFNQQINAVTPHEDVDPLFLYGLFVVVKPLVQRTATSSMKRIITKSKFERLQLFKPPLEQQQKFAQIVRNYERLRAQQHEAARQAEHLFATLLHRAFTPSP